MGHRKVIKYFTDEEIQLLHEQTLRILEEVGVEIDHDQMLGMLADSGAKIDRAKKRAWLPPSLVEKCLETAPKKVVYGARRENQDLVMKENSEPYLRTLTGADYIIDIENNRLRKVDLNDLTSWAVILDGLESYGATTAIHPHNVPLETRDVRCVQVMMENTTKHVLIQTYSGENLKAILEMTVVLRGTPEEVRKRPPVSVLTSAQSPLQYKRYTIDVHILAGKYGIPIELNTMPNGGATAPITPAGIIVLSNAEELAGVVISQVANPGAPVVYCPRQMIMDMLTGLPLEGAIENAMISAAGVQLAREHYGIPVTMHGPATDSLIHDGQSMIEKSMNALLPALVGANAITGAGMLEHCFAVSFIQLVIDSDIFGMVLEVVRGPEITKQTIGLEAVRRAGPGGNFLTDAHTLKFMRNAYFRPRTFNRVDRKTWESEGSKDIIENARERVKEILAGHKVEPLDESVTKELRLIVEKIEKKRG